MFGTTICYCSIKLKTCDGILCKRVVSVISGTQGNGFCHASFVEKPLKRRQHRKVFQHVESP